MDILFATRESQQRINATYKNGRAIGFMVQRYQLVCSVVKWKKIKVQMRCIRAGRSQLIPGQDERRQLQSRANTGSGAAGRTPTAALEGDYQQRRCRANAGSGDVQGGFCKIESLGEKMTCRIWRNWKKWKLIRDKILVRDNYQCQFCKLTLEQLKICYGRFERLLIVHHIDGNDQNNQPENLVTLCYTCHYYSAFVDSPVHKELRSPAVVTSRANTGSGDIQSERWQRNPQ